MIFPGEKVEENEEISTNYEETAYQLEGKDVTLGCSSSNYDIAWFKGNSKITG